MFAEQAVVDRVFQEKADAGNQDQHADAQQPIAGDRVFDRHAFRPVTFADDDPVPDFLQDLPGGQLEAARFRGLWDGFAKGFIGFDDFVDRRGCIRAFGVGCFKFRDDFGIGGFEQHLIYRRLGCLEYSRLRRWRRWRVGIPLRQRLQQFPVFAQHIDDDAQGLPGFIAVKRLSRHQFRQHHDHHDRNQHQDK